MNVLLLSREYPPHVYGGAGVVVDHLSRALARRASVEVRYFGAGDAERAEPGLRVRGYPPWERLAGGGPARYAPALEALSVGLAMSADPVDADVVHSHTWYAALGGLLVKKLFDIPLVVTLHSLEPLRPWKEHQLGRGYVVSSWAEAAAVEEADRIIAVSAQMRDDILAHFRVDPSRVVVLHNGVDASAFRRTERRDALDRHGVRAPYVLFVGRISEQKGIFPLLEAAAHFPPTSSWCSARRAPTRPRSRRGSPRRWRAGRASAGSMRCCPTTTWCSSTAMRALFVCPSVYEPFGLINLEAMACGTAVVASRVGGIPEVVVDGETGILVPPGEPEALAAAVSALCGDPERAARFGAAGRRRVEAEFSWERIAERTLAVYRDAIANHEAGRA